MSTSAPARALAGTLLLLLPLLVSGCAGDASRTAGTPADSVATESAGAPTLEQAREAGAVAKAIEAEPGRLEEILAEHGMTAESLEALILEIAKDPELSEAYEAARAAS